MRCVCAFIFIYYIVNFQQKAKTMFRFLLFICFVEIRYKIFFIVLLLFQIIKRQIFMPFKCRCFLIFIDFFFSIRLALSLYFYTHCAPYCKQYIHTQKKNYRRTNENSQYNGRSIFILSIEMKLITQ